jgi:type I restriction enzyme, R subunit
MSATPEQNARLQIDAQLAACGWVVQDYKQFNPSAGRGIALREAPLKSGTCDHLLLVDRMAVGIIEAKKPGTLLSGVAEQSGHYAENLPDFIQSASPGPLPFLYESTGVETFFRDERDPSPRSRRVFSFHRPETLAAWAAETSTLRARLADMPAAYPLPAQNLRACQAEGITHLEDSFAAAHPRALIQMATGAGKTYTACSFTYRLIKYAGAKRVLFLVDRSNLGRQAMTEFQQFVAPDTGRKFTEVYNVQHLTSNQLDSVARVTICTIQRLYSILRGEELDEDLDEKSGYEIASALQSHSSSGGSPLDKNQSGSGVSPLNKKQSGSGVSPLNQSRDGSATIQSRDGSATIPSRDGSATIDVAYSALIPPEAFDFIITDECHRSIYGLWRQVLEYFDAFIVGLTATPSKQTIGFFNENLVMEYNHERAVADGVNVGYEVYRIRTQVTEQGGTVEKGFYVDRRSKETRAVRWERLDEDLAYAASDLDRSVVVKSQIRTVLQSFRDALFTELFPGRALVPKTLIFCKDDSHAEDTVHLVREVFGKGNDFAKKITYKTYNPETRRYEKSETLIQEFRTSPQLRIAVTVDMIATGTDIKPLECLVFLRDTRSRTYFEQMKGRGTRVLTPTDLQAVSGADARAKTHFVIVDAVGVCESDKTDSRPLERQRTVSFDKLLLGVALGKRDEDTLTTLAGRLARLDREITRDDAEALRRLTGGTTLAQMSRRLLDAVDPDKVDAASRRMFLAMVAENNTDASYGPPPIGYFNPNEEVSFLSGNLPHWRQDGTTYFVTFRLADSLPQEKLKRWREEMDAWLTAHPEPHDETTRREFYDRFPARLQRWLDAGYGSCVLAIPEVNRLVTAALQHFVGSRYNIDEFAVAANHVHAIVTPLSGHTLSDILHAWKSFTAHEILKVEAASRRLHGEPVVYELGAKRDKRRDAASTLSLHVWQKESFDHIVRSPASLEKFRAYIRGHNKDNLSSLVISEDLRRDAAATLVNEACAPFDLPALRDALSKAKQAAEQTIDSVTVDAVLSQGFDAAAKEKASALLTSFRDYIAQHRAEITALQILYSRPFKQRLTEPLLKELEKRLRDNHSAWTEDNLWNAFAATRPDQVRGRSQAGRFADLVALVRFTLEQQPVLKPFSETVNERFDAWLQAKQSSSGVSPLIQGGSGVSPLIQGGSGVSPLIQGGSGVSPLIQSRDGSATVFTPDQLSWLYLIRDHIATAISIEPDDLELSPFNQRGGLGKAHQLFGDQLPKLLDELNEVLAA